MFIKALNTIAVWQQSKCPITDEQIKKIGIYGQWNVIKPEKKTPVHGNSN